MREFTIILLLATNLAVPEQLWHSPWLNTTFCDFTDASGQLWEGANNSLIKETP